MGFQAILAGEMYRSLRSTVPLLLASLLVLTAAAGAQVPEPPRARADRFGVYAWGADYSAWPGAPDRLNWAAGRVAALGSRTIRVYLGTDDPYEVNPEDDEDDDGFLERIAASRAYDTLFRDRRFRTYLLTVYTPSDAANVWRGGFDAEEAAKERRQIARLGAYLLGNPDYAGKTFLLLNWEGDHAAGQPAEASDWDAFAAWIDSRAQGVRDAREEVPASRTLLFSGLEFNFVDRQAASGEVVRCGEAGTRCVIDAVAPRVTVDYYSYSAWQSVNVKIGNPRASLKERLRRDLEFALGEVRAGRPEVRPESFLLGEYGFARSIYGECLAAAHVQELVSALDSDGAFPLSWIVLWQVLDNRWRVEDGATRSQTACPDGLRDPEETPAEPSWSLYGLVSGRDGRRTLLGEVFKTALRGRRARLPRGCPALESAANLKGGPELRPEGALAVSGRGFSRGGNRVSLLQAHDLEGLGSRNRHFSMVPRGSRAESPTRIEVSFPSGELHEGCALVYVTDRRGIDSNALFVRIREIDRRRDEAGPGERAGPPP